AFGILEQGRWIAEKKAAALLEVAGGFGVAVAPKFQLAEAKVHGRICGCGFEGFGEVGARFGRTAKLQLIHSKVFERREEMRIALEHQAKLRDGFFAAAGTGEGDAEQIAEVQVSGGLRQRGFEERNGLCSFAGLNQIGGLFSGVAGGLREQAESASQ